MDPDKLSAIDARLTAMDAKIDMLITICTEIQQATVQTSQSCHRMDSHIDFINGTYTSLRAPLDFLRTRFGATGAPALPPSSTPPQLPPSSEE